MTKECFAYSYDGRLWLITGNTYQYKDVIKSYGGRWSHDTKSWIATTEQLRSLSFVERMVKVRREAYCHTLEEIMWVTESDLRHGQIYGQFCLRCDKRFGRPVRVHSFHRVEKMVGEVIEMFKEGDWWIAPLAGIS